MHRALVIALFASSVVAGSLAIAPDARAAARLSPAKVVIVVGATHGATASYRARADAAYAEARRHTSNVVKVYSPNATWTRVKAAAVGASVLIYFGHGNGWPSPYTYDPQYSTKDGFGLNSDTNGDGRLSDNENRYYGEPYVRTLDLAPNAIVMLHHLCYASGNSEPGHAQPTVTVARQRISNYAAGFLRTNAQAVIADGHRGPADYLRLLFTTDQTIESLWRTAPGNNGHARSFTSTRTSGVRALMDPEGTSSGFYRSLVTDPLLTTTMVTGIVDTSRHPGTMVVPGRAAVVTPDAPLYPDAATAAAGTLDAASTLPAGTRLAVLARSTQAAVGGAALYEVQGLDDPAQIGLVRGPDLVPRDSAPPRVLAVDPAAPVALAQRRRRGRHRDADRAPVRAGRLADPGPRRRGRDPVRGDRLRQPAHGDVGRARRWRAPSTTARTATSSRRPIRGRTPARGAGRCASTRPVRPCRR